MAGENGIQSDEKFENEGSQPSIKICGNVIKKTEMGTNVENMATFASERPKRRGNTDIVETSNGDEVIVNLANGSFGNPKN